MKVLVVTMALGAATASSALAQTMTAQRYDRSPRVVQPWTGQPPQRTYRQDFQTDGRLHSSNPAYDVYDSKGEYAGSDPDPAVRAQLRRDNPYDPNDSE